jgi:hypothetical protein
MTLDESVGKNINYMMAGFWGGNAGILSEICKKGSQMYISEFINKEQVDNEQVTFAFILKDYRSNIQPIYPNGIDYYNYYLFCYR